MPFRAVFHRAFWPMRRFKHQHCGGFLCQIFRNNARSCAATSSSETSRTVTERGSLSSCQASKRFNCVQHECDSRLHIEAARSPQTSIADAARHSRQRGLADTRYRGAPAAALAFLREGPRNRLASDRRSLALGDDDETSHVRQAPQPSGKHSAQPVHRFFGCH